MVDPKKKGGLDIAVAIGRPKPMKGGPGAMDAAPKDPMADEPDGDEDAGCMQRCESMLKKICEALGVEPDEETPDKPDMEGQDAA